MKIIYANDANKIIGSTNKQVFTYSIGTELTYSGSGTPVEQTTNDSVYDVVSGLSARTNKRISVVSAQDDFVAGIKRSNIFVSKTPSVATVSVDGLITGVSDGLAEISVQNGLTKKLIKEPITSSTIVAASSTFLRFVTGSLRYAIKAHIDSIIAGKSGDNPGGLHTDLYHSWSYPNLSATAINQYMYSNTDRSTFWTRNNAHILSAVDLTPMSAPRDYTLAEWQAAGGSSVGGNCCTAISPRHVYGASHWHLLDGMKTYFIAADNTVIERTILSSYNIPNTDIWIGYLNSALPASITPVKVLPDNYLTYLPANGYDFPAFVGFNSNGSFYIGRCGLGSSFYLRTPVASYGNDTTYSYLTDWTLVGQFGSGSAVFTVIGGSPVLLGSLWYAGYSGSSLVANSAAINAAMTALHGSSQYQLSTVDLSEFSQY